jgi:hypothetical protein
MRDIIEKYLVQIGVGVLIMVIGSAIIREGELFSSSSDNLRLPDPASEITLTPPPTATPATPITLREPTTPNCYCSTTTGTCNAVPISEGATIPPGSIFLQTSLLSTGQQVVYGYVRESQAPGEGYLWRFRTQPGSSGTYASAACLQAQSTQLETQEYTLVLVGQ